MRRILWSSGWTKKWQCFRLITFILPMDCIHRQHWQRLCPRVFHGLTSRFTDSRSSKVFTIIGPVKCRTHTYCRYWAKVIFETPTFSLLWCNRFNRLFETKKIIPYSPETSESTGSIGCAVLWAKTNRNLWSKNQHHFEFVKRMPHSSSWIVHVCWFRPFDGDKWLIWLR